MPAPLDTEFLGHRDLYVLDQAPPPQRLEQRIAEAQRHEVLHGLLAEIMIDTVDLLLGEHGAHLLVDEIGGRRIVTQRLFEHHARQRCDDSGLARFSQMTENKLDAVEKKNTRTNSSRPLSLATSCS